MTGALSTLNSLAAEHSAVAIIHTGDFGFYGTARCPQPPLPEAVTPAGDIWRIFSALD